MKTTPLTLLLHELCALGESQTILIARPVKPQPPAGAGRILEIRESTDPRDLGAFAAFDGPRWQARCPIGAAGDRRWVREVWAEIADEEMPDGRPNVVYQAHTFNSNATNIGVDRHGRPRSIPGRWSSASRMPRWASRSALAVEHVEVKRMRSLTPAQIEAVGVSPEGVAKMLAPLSARCETVQGYWFDRRAEGANIDANYCLKCAEAEAEKLRAAHPKVHPDWYRPDGGWTTDHDTPPFCEGCGARIDYTPTDECTNYEVDHFISSRKGTIGEGVAFELVQIFENVTESREKDIARIAWWAYCTLTFGAEMWKANPWIWLARASRVDGKEQG